MSFSANAELGVKRPSLDAVPHKPRVKKGKMAPSKKNEPPPNPSLMGLKQAGGFGKPSSMDGC